MTLSTPASKGGQLIRSCEYSFAQNNGVIALTRCASRKAGYFCAYFLIIMGIFAKFAAALVAIPSAVLGGMTTFLFAGKHVALAEGSLDTNASASRCGQWFSHRPPNPNEPP